MAFSPVDITSGWAPGASAASTATSSLVNWQLDATGAARPRCALSAHPVSGLPTDPVIGVQPWGRYLAIVTQSASTGQRRLYTSDRLIPGATARSGATLDGTSRPTFAVGTESIYIAGGSRLLYCPSAPGVASLVTGSPYCTHVVALGQRLVTNDIHDPTSIRHSDIGEGAWQFWPAENITGAEVRPDPVKGVFENGSELFVFGETTLQTYAVGSDPESPFDLIAGIEGGLGAPYAVARKDSTLFFLDERRRLAITDGRSREIVDADLGRTLRSFSTIDDCWAFYDTSEHRGQVCLVFPTVGVTYEYDLEAKRWAERAYYDAQARRVNYPATSASYWPAAGLYVFGSDLDGGGLLKADPDQRADMGGTVPIVCERITGWHDHGVIGYKRSSRLRVLLQRGTAAQNAAPSSVEVRVQNDGEPWSEWEPVSLGGPDDAETAVDLFVSGVFRRRRYHLRYAGSDETSIVALFDDVAECAT